MSTPTCDEKLKERLRRVIQQLDAAATKALMENQFKLCNWKIRSKKTA